MNRAGEQAGQAVLVTGGAGYIGSHLALALVDRGARVVVLDDLSTGHAAAVPRGAAFVEGDVGDTALLRRVLREHAVGAVFHLAGSSVVSESCADPLGYYANNTLASHGLVAEALAAGVGRIVFSSTAAVYGATDRREVDETAPAEPVTPYGASKLMVERMLADAGRAHGLAHASLRYFNVAGADPHGRLGQSTAAATHLIKVGAQAALGLRPCLEVFGDDYPTPDGTCLRDYIHVADLVDAHIAVLAHLGRDGAAAGGAGAVFNCGYGRGHSVLEVIEALRAETGADFPVRVAPRREGDVAALVAVADRLRAATGWRPRRDSLRTIVREAVAWERRLASGAAAPATHTDNRAASGAGTPPPAAAATP